MDKKEFIIIVKKIKAELEKNFNQVNMVDVEHGVRIALVDQELYLEIVTIYNSKDIINIVYNKKNKELNQLIPKLLGKYQKRLEVSQKSYIGIDESGKGDYFGPLVIGGFISNEEIDEELLSMGVKDGKLLTDKKVKQLGQYLIENYSENHTIIPIEPEYYNSHYAKLRLVGGNMQKIIEGGQKEVVQRLVARNKEIACILSDATGGKKYYKDEHIVQSQTIPYKEAINAERNPAVAAAGILARYTFLLWLETHSQKYHIDLYKGANNKVIQSAINYIEKYGKDTLFQVAKLHFKTTQKVMAGYRERTK